MRETSPLDKVIAERLDVIPLLELAAKARAEYEALRERHTTLQNWGVVWCGWTKPEFFVLPDGRVSEPQ